MMTPLDPEITEFLERIGKRKDPEVNREVAVFYAARAYEKALSLTIVTDVAYGPHARQRLDIFAPVGATDKVSRPVVIFVHGGGFVGGAKALRGTPFYGNVGRFYANRGFVAVVAGYRLAPEAIWPAARDDVAASVAWVRDQIAEYGGDPEAIVCHGHSAGGAHVADYLHERSGNDGLVGAILQSAIVSHDVYQEPTIDGIAAYYGTDATHRKSRVAWIGAGASPIEFMIAYCDRDPDSFKTDAAGQAAALSEAGLDPVICKVAEHGHLSSILSLGTGDMSLGNQLIAFIDGVAARRRGDTAFGEVSSKWM